MIEQEATGIVTELRTRVPHLSVRRERLSVQDALLGARALHSHPLPHCFEKRLGILEHDRVNLSYASAFTQANDLAWNR